MNETHRGGGEGDRRHLLRAGKSFVAVSEAEHLAHAVEMVELEHHRPNHRIETWTKAAAGDNADPSDRRVEVDTFPGTGLFEQERGREGLALVGFRVIDNACLFRDEVGGVVPATVSR